MIYTVDTVALKKLMIDNNYETFGQLAEAADLSRNTVADVVNGKIRPSTAVMEKLIMALHIEPCNAGVIFFIPNLRNA